MQKKSVLQISLIGVLSAFQIVTAQTGWSQDNFAIGSWLRPNLSYPVDPDRTADEIKFQKYKNAYFNMAGSDGTGLSQAHMDSALALASRVGIRYMVNALNFVADYKSTPFNAAGYGTPPNYYDWVYYCGTTDYGNSVVAHYAGLSPALKAAICGYFISEEDRPCITDAADNCIDWNCAVSSDAECSKAWRRKLQSLEPNRVTVDLARMPWGDPFTTNSIYPPMPCWETYMDVIFNDPNDVYPPKVLVYDSYSMMGYNLDPPLTTGQVLPNFFWSLNTARQKAQGRPFWIYLQAVGYGYSTSGYDECYVNPDETRLRFQIFCSIAYGAKGVSYFSYMRPDPPSQNGEAYYDAIMNDDNYSPLQPANNPPLHHSTRPDSTKYAIVREINRYVTNIVGPVVMTSDYVNAYHRCNGGGLDPHDPANYLVWGGIGYHQGSIPSSQVLGQSANDVLVQTLNHDRLMVGCFRDKVNPKTYYLLIVNKSFDIISDATITLKGDRRNNVALYPSVYNYNGSVSTTAPTVSYASPYSTVTVGEMQGGEGRLIKVTNVGTSSTQPGFRPGAESAVTMNADKVFCFVRGTDGNLWYRRQEAPNTDYFGSKWTSLGAITGSIATGCRSKTNRQLCVFARNSSNYLTYRAQTDSTNNTWAPSWTTFSTTINSSSRLCVSRFGSNEDLIILFKRNSDSKLYYYYASNGTINSTPVAVPGSFAIGNFIAAGYNPGNGSIDVFVTKSADNRMYRVNMTSSRTWGSFTALTKEGGAIMTSSNNIAIESNPGNRLDVFASSGGYIWHCWQNATGGSWSNFTRLSNATSAEIPDDANSPRLAVGKHADGHLEVFAKGRDGFLKHIWQADGMCSGWTCSLVNGGAPAASITIHTLHMTNHKDGRPIVFAAGSDLGNMFFTSSWKYDPWWQPCIALTNNF